MKTLKKIESGYINTIQSVKEIKDDLVKEIKQIKESVMSVKTKTTPIPPKQPTYADKIKEKENVIIIKPKENQNNNKTREDIKNTIDPTNLALKINNVKDIQNGAVIIKGDEKSVKKIENEFKTKLSENYNIKIPVRKKPRVLIIGMKVKMCEEELVKALKCQNELKDCDIKCVHIYLSPKIKCYNAVVEMDSVAYAKVMESTKVSIGWDRCRVYQHASVLRCFNCCGFNHSSRNCTKEKVCVKCAGNHDVKDCKNVENKCVNCCSAKANLKIDLNTNHTASDVNCPVFQRKLKIAEERTDY